MNLVVKIKSLASTTVTAIDLSSYRVEHGQQLDELVNMTRQAQESVSAQHKPIDSAG